MEVGGGEGVGPVDQVAGVARVLGRPQRGVELEDAGEVAETGGSHRLVPPGGRPAPGVVEDVGRRPGGGEAAHGGAHLPEAQLHQAPVVLESERDLDVAQRPYRRRHRGVHRRPLGHLAERVGEEEAALELQAHGHRRRGQGAGAGGVGQRGVGPAPLDVDAHAHGEGVGQERGVAGRLGLGHGPVGQDGGGLDPALPEKGQQGNGGGGRRPGPVAGRRRLVQQALGLVAGGGRILRQPAARLLDPVT